MSEYVEVGEVAACRVGTSGTIALDIQGYSFFVDLDDDSLDMEAFYDRYGFDASVRSDIHECLITITLKGIFDA